MHCILYLDQRSDQQGDLLERAIKNISISSALHHDDLVWSLNLECSEINSLISRQTAMRNVEMSVG